MHVCPVCLGLPGSKPSLNKKALELGLTIAKKLGCTIPETTWFSRKTYFYPDLCKHFQITQYDTPIGLGLLMPSTCITYKGRHNCSIIGCG